MTIFHYTCDYELNGYNPGPNPTGKNKDLFEKGLYVVSNERLTGNYKSLWTVAMRNPWSIADLYFHSLNPDKYAPPEVFMNMMYMEVGVKKPRICWDLAKTSLMSTRINKRGVVTLTDRLNKEELEIVLPRLSRARIMARLALHNLRNCEK